MASGTSADVPAVPQNVVERNQFLVNELVSSDGQLGPTLRALYDSESCDPAQFLKTLDEFVGRTDSDIERICNKYYQEFIHSIDELLQVRSDAQALKDIIHLMGKTASDSSQPLIEASEKLLMLRKIQRNILLTIETLTNCVPIIQLYCKATTQLKEKKFYPALKSLDELEQLHLTPDITYSFADKMRERVPQLRAQVGQTAFDDLQGFLTDIRDRATKIGETAIKQVQSGTTEDNSSSQDVQFNLLHRSLHIYGVLSKRQTGESYYKAERKKQAVLVLEPFDTMAGLTESEAYKQCFYQVAGFFIVEHTVLGTAQGLLSKQWVDNLWDQAVQHMANVMNKRLKTCKSASTISAVKNLIVDFCQTLSGYGYNCNRLYAICVRAKDPYTNVLVTQCGEKFKEVFLKDTYAQCHANDEDEYTRIIQKFPYRDRVLEEAPFPRVFPFSEVVPEIYQIIIKFIETSVAFVQYLDLSNTEIDESVRKSTNLLLSKTLNGTLSQVIRTRHLSLQQLTQISVNTTCLQDSCKALEQRISAITHSVEDDMHLHYLHGASVFKDARGAAEEKLFDVLKEQIDQFMDLSEFDWAPHAPASEPSPYMYDMLAYLTTVFASLTHMPIEVARHAYFQTCKYIAMQLLLSLNGPATGRVNHDGFESFKLDLEMCEEYALDCPISASNDNDNELFRVAFSKLRQMVNLFLNWDLEGYLHASTRKANYRDLPVTDVLLVVKRYEHETEGATKRMQKRDGKKKRQESADIIKRLEALAAQS